jgi:hypothetical protein
MDNLNNIPNVGNWGDAASRLNDNFNKIKQAVTTVENTSKNNKGYFDTLASLQAAFPSPKAGNIAYVADVASSTGYYIYNVVAGVWTATTTEAPAVGVEISNYAQHGYSSSPKTLKEVEDDLALKANHGYDAGETPKSLKQVDDLLIKYQNIISNGNFADGTTSGWSVYNSTGTIQVINGILEHTANGTRVDGHIQKTISPVTGKRYIAAKVRVTNSLCTNLSVRTVRRSGATPYQSIATPLQDTWYIVSNLIDPSSFIGGENWAFYFQVKHDYPSKEIADGKKMEVEFVIDIDLTATFGTGNEPSKQFMDDLLSKVGYFEEYVPKSDILLSLSTDAKHGYPSLAEAKTVKQLADEVSVLDNKTLNIKPINLFEWGRLNALGFHAGANTNYTINELGHIITAGTIYIDIPVTHLRGRRIFFGTKAKFSYLEYCHFYNNTTQLSSPAPVKTNLGIDENGFGIYSITHPSNGDIVPLEATHIRIQYRVNVEIVEIYAGETPYTGDTLYPQDLKSPEPYKYLGGIEIATQESSAYPPTKGIATFNPDGTISITAGGNTSIDVALNLNPIIPKIKGKTVYMNVKAENTDLRGVYFQLYCYNVTSGGVFNGVQSIYFSISSGEITTLPFLIPDSTNWLRLIIKAATAGDINIDSISFSESKHYSTDIKVYDDTSTALSEAKAYTDTRISEIGNILERETLYEAMQENLQNVLVGTKQFRKVTEDNVTNITDEVNNPKIYYSPKKRLPYKVQNLMVVDTKGTVQDSYNRGRVLEWISPDGWMYFRNAYNTYQKISVETFLSNLIPHDGSGITSDNIDWLELPAEQTIAEKAAKLAEELPNWKMYDETKSSDFQTVYSEAGIGWITRQMANGSLVNQNKLIRKDGTVVQPILKNPVVGNPTHLIIKENGVVLYELPLKNATSSPGIKWGEMKANQGDITYDDNIYAAINFNHNKAIIITGINLLSGHTYDFTLRGRRYGTNCVNGSVDIINVAVIGSIPLTDPIMGGTNSATLVDNTATITLNKNITEVTLRANAPTEKPFTYGNGASATPNWGYMASDDKMLITEYEPTAKRAGMAYLSQDNGESYDVLFDVSLNENFCNVGGGHIHGGCFDPYWNKIILVLGDSDFAKGIYHADYVDGLKQDNVSWTREVPPSPFYGAANGEQHCSAYPHEDFILFGTDCVPTGIFRMPRINKKKFTKREPSKLISGGNLSHIPSMFFRENENSPIFIATMRGTPDHPDRLYNTSIYHATWDGIYVQEIFKDKIRCTGFGLNSFMGIFYYKGKVFMTQFGDNRFENGHTLFIGDYRV